ncbi:MAG: D-glycero-beta-D-manno-heptose 1,7-bisphosphate 7-phosphatase [Gammaproteobacteria bacterium]|nr:MAG: D-glycero-beta-D-manno-heptose 1,7-bisphosphate 7-phosphatase [Gammaproteobacteria bacterium]
MASNIKLVILDRDGVINQDSDEFIKSPDEWIPIEGSLEAITRLTNSGYHVVVISNQSGLARGLFSTDDLNRVHNKMHHAVHQLGGSIDAVFFCPHGPAEGCLCRKPATGMFEDMAARLNIDLVNVPAIGDSLRDVIAARAVGASPILVRTGKGEKTVSIGARELAGVPIFDNLAAAVDDLLARQKDA